MTRINPLLLACSFALALTLGTFLAALDWCDQHRAKAAGAEWEGSL